MVRGADWVGGNADELEGGSGRGAVVRGTKGVVAVKWENGNYRFYKMGAGGKVKIAPPVINQVIYKLEETRSTPDYDSEDESETEDAEDEHNMKAGGLRR